MADKAIRHNKSTHWIEITYDGLLLVGYLLMNSSIVKVSVKGLRCLKLEYGVVYYGFISNINNKKDKSNQIN